MTYNPKPKLTFDDFLVFQHSDQYVGTDDNMIDSCDDWISNLDEDDLMLLAQRYGNIVYREGFLAGMDRSINKLMEGK